MGAWTVWRRNGRKPDREARERDRPEERGRPVRLDAADAQELEALVEELSELNASFFGVDDARRRMAERVRRAFGAAKPVGWITEALEAEGARGEVLLAWALGAPSRPSGAAASGEWDALLERYAGRWRTTLGDERARLLLELDVRPRESATSPFDVYIETRWIAERPGQTLGAPAQERRMLVVGRPSAERIELEDPTTREGLLFVEVDGAPALACPHRDATLVLARSGGPYR